MDTAPIVAAGLVAAAALLARPVAAGMDRLERLFCAHAYDVDPLALVRNARGVLVPADEQEATR